MILPEDQDELQKCVAWLIQRCLSTREDREKMYQYREKHYLFGNDGYQTARVNVIESHLDLVTSFLYAPDHSFYHCAAQNGDDPIAVLKAIAFQDDFNDDFQTCGISAAIMAAIPWSLVYDTMIPKQGWNRDTDEWFMELVPPHNFGVFQEHITNLDWQQAFCHTYFIDYQTAIGKLLLAGREDDLERIKVTNTASINQFPEMLQRMIVSGMTGASLSGTLFGQVNPDYAPSITYQAQSNSPLVRWNELWVWDDRYLDYRVFQTVDPDIFVSDSKHYIEQQTKATSNVVDLFGRLDKIGKGVTKTNPFLPGVHPFSKIQPYGKYNYFWGKAHIDCLIPLQGWLLERIDQIDDILDRQADPARVGSGFLGLSEEKMAAFGGAGTYLFDQLPQAAVKELAPDMPPDIFAEYREIKGEFLQASGLTEVISGHSEKGVRSHQHSQDLKKSGSGRIKKAALALEPALEKIGDVGAKLKMAHDDTELVTEPDENDKTLKFLSNEVGPIRMRVDGHSHSPLFGDESRELAFVLKKAGAIDNNDLIRMTNPPSRDNLLHRLRLRERQQRKMAAMHPELLTGAGKTGARGRK